MYSREVQLHKKIINSDISFQTPNNFKLKKKNMSGFCGKKMVPNKFLNIGTRV